MNVNSQQQVNTFKVSDVIDSHGINKYTWRIFILLLLAMIFDGYDYMIVSYTMKQISAEWGLNIISTGSLTSWSLFGLMLGGIFGGSISDRFGRRKTIITAIVAYSIFTIPAAFAPNFAVFAFFRVLVGLGLGACIPAVTTTISETSPTSHRAVFITMVMAGMVTGWAIAGVVATFIVPHLGWRTCYLIGALPLVYAIFLYFKLPESIHWLASTGHYKDAVKELRRFEMAAGGNATDWNPQGLTMPPAPPRVGLKAIFSGGYIRATVTCWIMYGFASSVVYGVNAWLPSIMLEKGFSLATAYWLSTAQNAAGILACVLTGFISEKLGRRWSVISASLLVIIAILMVSYSGLSFAAVLVSNLFVGFAISLNANSIQPIIAESYRTEFRNTGIAWTHASARLFGAFAPIIAGFAIGYFTGYSKAFLIYIIPIVFVILAATFLLERETKGKTLEQLAEEEYAKTA